MGIVQQYHDLVMEETNTTRKIFADGTDDIRLLDQFSVPLSRWRGSVLSVTLTMARISSQCHSHDDEDQFSVPLSRWRGSVLSATHDDECQLSVPLSRWRGSVLSATLTMTRISSQCHSRWRMPALSATLTTTRVRKMIWVSCIKRVYGEKQSNQTDLDVANREFDRSCHSSR